MLKNVEKCSKFKWIDDAYEIFINIRDWGWKRIRILSNV